MVPFVRRCGAAVLDGVSEVVDGGTTTVRAGERPKTRVSLRANPQRGRRVMPWEWMPAGVRCTLASTSTQPSRPSQNQSCEKIQGIGRIPFC